MISERFRNDFHREGCFSFRVIMCAVAGTTGVNCSINIDECASSPCAGNSTCYDQINSYVCRCNAGYTGMLLDNAMGLVNCCTV